MKTQFHTLRVASIERLTDDAAALTFAVPTDLEQEFQFSPGQSLTIRRGAERRSYSICAAAGEAPRIGVREVAGGAVSSWLVHDVRPGDELDVLAPSGRFVPDLATPAHHVLIAAGSGITPMISIARSVLEADESSTVTLLYGNRRVDSVMFADELADCKDAHHTRMQLVHVLSREPQEVQLFGGRIDAERLTAVLTGTVDVAAVDHWWLCGPLGMVHAAQDVLRQRGVPRERVHRELFWVGDEPPEQARHEEAAQVDGAAATIVLDGRSTLVTVPPDTAVLDAAQQVRPDLPFACKGGVCGTCRARVTDGAATMRRNYALEPEEVAAGYILTCQAIPTTDTLTVDYDS
ncbi:MAG: phenylacetate-CoA oxygenase/reductase subunit PaaK [Actinomycetota bacterium]|nr:phenylacetate-CoA oxygenase/reductase subunit PaaK [Actinomycetota bacterium]